MLKTHVEKHSVSVDVASLAYTVEYNHRRSRELLHLLVSLKDSHGKDEDGGVYTQLNKCVEDLQDVLVKGRKGHPFHFDMEHTIIYGPGTIPVSR